MSVALPRICVLAKAQRVAGVVGMTEINPDNANQVAGAIMAEAALSFLGLGLPITQPSLGTLIRSGYDLIFAGIWWVTVLPGLTLVSVLVAVNILGDGLRDALDPRLTPR